jgi:hypothetical protein
METRRGNVFTVNTVTAEGSYIKVTGEYKLNMPPEFASFEEGDILTEDKYDGHQIYVASATKDEDGNDCLTLDRTSNHPSIKKPLERIVEGLHLFNV